MSNTTNQEMDELALENNLSLENSEKQTKVTKSPKIVVALALNLRIKTLARKKINHRQQEKKNSAKEKPALAQAHIEQRPMKAGKRISPLKLTNNDNKQEDSMQKQLKSGRKIVEAPAAERRNKAKSDAEKKPAPSYTPGRKIVDASGSKVEDKPA